MTDASPAESDETTEGAALNESTESERYDSPKDLPSDRPPTDHSEGNDDHHHDSDPSWTPLFLPISQLQRWGEEQKPLHTEWGNTFFDLFYVAAAYNLGNLLREDLSARGFFYLVALFFPIMNWWTYRMVFTARFELPKDLFHNTFLVLGLLPLGTAILHIRTVPILSDPKHHIDMFLFCLSLSIGYFMYFGLLIEVMYCQWKVKSAKLFPEAFHMCKQLFLIAVPPAIFSFVATLHTGIEYYTFDESSSKTEDRLLAGESDTFDDGPMDDVAAWMLVAGTLSNFLTMIFLAFGRGIFYGRGQDYDFRKYTVPMHINFALHRYGEWTMLLLGESVLSLLIVDLGDGQQYYQIFFSGIVTVILLEYLHFRSQPHEPDDHALRTSRLGAFAFFYFFQFYSVSLIVLGASYKFFLWEAVFDDDQAGKDRRLLFPMLERLLAGETTSLRFDTEDRQQRIANLFSGSLAMVWLCLDIIALAHKGFSNNVERLNNCPKGKAMALSIVGSRVGLIIFAATLSQYVTNPVTLAIIGLVGIFAQLCLRFAGSVIFPPTAEEAEDEAITKAINFAKARVRETELERTHGPNAIGASGSER